MGCLSYYHLSPAVCPLALPLPYVHVSLESHGVVSYPSLFLHLFMLLLPLLLPLLFLHSSMLLSTRRINYLSH